MILSCAVRLGEGADNGDVADGSEHSGQNQDQAHDS